MSTVLAIHGSPRGERSHSRRLADAFLQAWQAANPQGLLTRREVGRGALPHVSEAFIAAAFYPQPEARPLSMQADLALSDELVAELLGHQRLVISAPMHNFSVPSGVKAWVDHIVRLGLTFNTQQDNGVAQYQPLVPGMLGFVRLLLYPYWYGIIPALRRGGAQVIAVQVSPLNSSEVRGEQLLAQIQRIMADTGAARVNLIGHSQGALTARYAAAKRPDWVASVTSVAGPNHGSELADYLQRHSPAHSLRGRVLSLLLRGISSLMRLLETGYRGPKQPVDIHASHQSLTTEGVALFNRQYPQGLPQEWGGQGPAQVDGVHYYSWSGILQPGKTNRGRNLFDGTNRSCRLFARTFVREAGQCDGMVGRYSSHLGQVIGDDYPLDHFDIVNQSLGLVGKGAEPIRLFVEHARRLKAAGL